MLAGSGCKPEGKPGNTGPGAPGGPGGLWCPNMAESTVPGWLGGLERSWGAEGGGMDGGLEMEASLNRCSVNEALWCGIGASGILERNGRLGTI